MIQRSQRHKTQTREPAHSTTLDLHERLARQRLWFLRFVTASAATLVVSFVLWLVRVPLPWHLGAMALSFLAGLFVHRPMQTWAVSWIRDRMGLSYETALEQTNQSDSFGFVNSLRERASEEASKLAPPKYQAWWLPMVAVAIGLAFLPLIPQMAALPTGLTTAPTTTTPPARQEAANAPEPNAQEQAPAAQEANATDPTPSESPSAGETNASELSDATGTGSADSSPNTQSADEEALGRFLDNLREPPEQEAPPDLNSVMSNGEPGSQSSDQNNASRPRNAQTNPFEQAGENQPQAQGSQQSQGQEQGQGEQGGQQDQAQQGAADASQGEQGQGAEQDQAQQAQAEQGAGEESASEDPNAAGQSAGQQAGEEQGQEGQQGGDQGTSADGSSGDSSSDSGQNADGAGSLPGTPTSTGNEDIGSSQQNPEFLEGQINEGPNNAAGTVRLPGETQQTVFPDGSAPTSFSRADEEALTEGRIPLEYQEVIRNYFRGSE